MNTELQKLGVPLVQFTDNVDSVTTTIFLLKPTMHDMVRKDLSDVNRDLIEFCSIPRTRQEITDFFGVGTTSYVVARFVAPLVEAGVLSMTVPESPKSKFQKYFATKP
ncbi:MAG: hypothetical protein Q4E62_04070 [Sutterellaceae bacterium]|nr:hypothetical protein [Sutterellaceae bacterium]